MSENTGSNTGTVTGSKWVDEVEETTNEEGGGDYFGLVNIAWAYQFFKSGVDNEELHFPYNKQDKTGKSKAEALAKANQAIVKYGLEPKKIETSFVMFMRTSQMFGRDTSAWKTKSMFWVLKVWDPNMAEIVIPHMDKLGISPYTTQVWAKISQAKDVGNYMKDGLSKEGKPIKIPKRVAYISAVYPDEASCRAAAEQESGATNPPAGQSEEDEIRQVHLEDPTMTLFAISPLYNGKSCKDLVAILSYTREEVDDDVRRLKDEKLAPEEVAKFYGMAPVVVKRLWEKA